MLPLPQRPRLILTSRSPRRSQMLREAGYEFNIETPPFDDPAQPDTPDHGDTPRLAQQLAEEKARSLAENRQEQLEPDRMPAVILAADTLCIDADGHPVGKPQTHEQLLAMLQCFVDATHHVTTGVALLDEQNGQMTAFSDTAEVVWGPVSEKQLQTYADSNAWQGKAGGYNLQDRVAAGWPITVTGDPGTVTGLPMIRLIPQLERLGITALPHPC